MDTNNLIENNVVNKEVEKIEEFVIIEEKPIQYTHSCWKELFSACDIPEEEYMELAELLLDYEINEWKDYVDNSCLPDEITPIQKEKLETRMKFERSVKRGERMRLRNKLSDQQTDVPNGYKDWNEFFLTFCHFDPKQVEKYSKFMIYHDFYLCHWKLLQDIDLKGLIDDEDCEEILYLILHSSNPSLGFKMREKLIELKLIKSHKKIDVPGAFSSWIELLQKSIPLPNVPHESYANMLESQDIFLCHWDLLSNKEINALLFNKDSAIQIKPPHRMKLLTYKLN